MRDTGRRWDMTGCRCSNGVTKSQAPILALSDNTIRKENTKCLNCRTYNTTNGRGEDRTEVHKVKVSADLTRRYCIYTDFRTWLVDYSFMM